MSAVIADTAPNTVYVRQHVITKWDKGTYKYFIGFVVETVFKRPGGTKYKVHFDDDAEKSYSATELRVFPDASNAQQRKF